jgi:hypothetical protein
VGRTAEQGFGVLGDVRVARVGIAAMDERDQLAARITGDLQRIGVDEPLGGRSVEIGSLHARTVHTSPPGVAFLLQHFAAFLKSSNALRVTRQIRDDRGMDELGGRRR